MATRCWPRAVDAGDQSEPARLLTYGPAAFVPVTDGRRAQRAAINPAFGQQRQRTSPIPGPIRTSSATRPGRPLHLSMEMLRQDRHRDRSSTRGIALIDLLAGAQLRCYPLADLRPHIIEGRVRALRWRAAAFRAAERTHRRGNHPGLHFDQRVGRAALRAVRASVGQRGHALLTCGSSRHSHTAAFPRRSSWQGGRGDQGKSGIKSGNIMTAGDRRTMINTAIAAMALLAAATAAASARAPISRRVESSCRCRPAPPRTLCRIIGEKLTQ